MTEDAAPYGDEPEKELTYEEKVQKLDEILTRLDNSETPIDKLSEDVKLGAKLIKELSQKLKQVEMDTVWQER